MNIGFKKNYIYSPKELYLKNWVKKFFYIAGFSYHNEDVSYERMNFPVSFKKPTGKVVLGLGLGGRRDHRMFIKNFSLEYLRGFLGFLKDKDVEVKLFGLSEGLDRGEIAAITRQFSFVEDFVDKLSLEQTLNFLSQCDVVLCVNSFFMHVGFSLGKPLVILSGGVDYREYLLARANSNYTVIEADRRCVPCKFLPLPLCLETRKAYCIDSIPYKTVFSELMRLAK